MNLWLLECIVKDFKETTIHSMQVQEGKLF